MGLDWGICLGLWMSGLGIKGLSGRGLKMTVLRKLSLLTWGALQLSTH